MQTGYIPVCSMDMFDDGLQHFRIGQLQRLEEYFPMLEYPHKNAFYTLLFSDNWQSSINIDTHTLQPSGTGIIIIKPGCINAIHTNNITSGTILCFSEDFFSLRYNNNVLNQFGFLHRESNPFIRILPKSVSKITSILTLLQEEFTSAQTTSVNILRSYLNILLEELERTYSPIPVPRTRNLAQDKIAAFEKLVEENFIAQKRPSGYAALLNVSTNYLNKLCKKETGQTAGDIIRKHIIIEAQRLLHYTRLSVGEIAVKLGFESTSYFVTTFKKHTQLTPEQFRKSQNI